MSRFISKLASTARTYLHKIRTFSLYIFDKGKLTTFTVEIEINHPGRTVRNYYGTETIHEIVDDATKTETIQYIAGVLKDLSHGDDEFYANYVIQITKQLKYSSSQMNRTYVQHPLYTLCTGSGVCIDHVLLCASILKAGGLRVAIILAEVKTVGTTGNHAMIAIWLPHRPRLPAQYHYWARVQYGLPLSANITIEGETWYLADPTPSDKPLNLLQFKNIYPTLVGEHTWDRLEIKEIIIL
ncbi:hypothetical protein J7L70_03825 [Candidatus Bathyarchaeota archaeon]|nr:hypothetical protein [Candidatus Bathyarchaeota archaeon]